jgi:hypothetical protein
MAHDGIEVEDDGTAYMIDESNDGSIYKFEPDNPRDLSSGTLYVGSVAAPAVGTDGSRVEALLYTTTGTARHAILRKRPGSGDDMCHRSFTGGCH